MGLSRVDDDDDRRGKSVKKVQRESKMFEFTDGTHRTVASLITFPPETGMPYLNRLWLSNYIIE